jgi:hypothetical protein
MLYFGHPDVRAMSLSNLSPPIRALLSALETRDGVAFRAILSDGATLTDEGRGYQDGTIAMWFGGTFLPRTQALRAINETRRDGEVVLTIRTDERDPCGRCTEVLRDWHLAANTEGVAAVRIERRTMPDLPDPIAEYVRATNRGDLEALLVTFDDDALVNDQLHDYWGKAAIREWAAHEIIGERMTMHVVRTVEHHGHVIVTATINGDFDRRGLPDPLLLTFYFSASRDRIVLLIILRNQSGL